MKPFSKARPRVTIKGTYMPKAYIESQKLLRRLVAASSYRNIDFQSVPIHVNLIFCFKTPKSWTKKMKANPDSRRIAKDIDNLQGGVFDALNGVLWKDDKDIVSVMAVKKYGDEDSIEIEILRAD
jgi:Holliday junction resolvase RusA-like endonuclease